MSIREWMPIAGFRNRALIQPVPIQHALISYEFHCRSPQYHAFHGKDAESCISATIKTKTYTMEAMVHYSIRVVGLFLDQVS